MNTYAIGSTVKPQLTAAQAAALSSGILMTADGSVVAGLEIVPPVVMNATGLAFNGRCAFQGIRINAFAGGTPTLTVYDATSATGTPIMTITVTALGPQPVWGAGVSKARENANGVWVVLGGTGTCTWEVGVEGL